MLIDFPNELLNKIFEHLNYSTIKKCLLINSKIYDRIISIILLMKYEEFTMEFINKNLNKNNINEIKIARILINNLKFNSWLDILKLRYIPFFIDKEEFRHPVRIIPNHKLFSLIQRHPERFLISEPEIILSGYHKKRKKGDYNEITVDINFSYHNCMYNEMISYNSIVFDCRTTIVISGKIIRVYSNFRIVKDNIDILNIFSYGSQIYLYKKPLFRKLNFDINYNSKKSKKTRDILVKENDTFLKQREVFNFACYSMSLMLDLEIENNIKAGDILLDIMSDYMGEKKNIKNKLLFGNLRENYIPQGNYTCL